MLWVDKHRPIALEKLDFHKEQASQLQALAKSGELPHLLFYGPSGAGKKTRVMALLREVFGPGVEKVKLEHRGFKTPTGRAVEVTTIASHFVRILKGGSGEFVPRLTRSPFQHVEINPGDAGIYDRYVVQEIIKELAQYSPSAAASAASTASGHARGWKVLLLSEVDRLSKEAQAALRRTMEKYSATCRLILVCSSPSKVIEPVRSRCLGIRVPAASQQDVMAVLATVAKKEGMALPPQLCAKIASQSNRNLRRALLLLEAAKVSAPGGVVSPQQPVPSMDWERYIGVLAQDILKEQSPKALLACRARLYELIVNCIPGDVILKRLLLALVGTSGMTESLQQDLCVWAAHYEHRLQLGNKELFHLEAFIAKAMLLIKTVTTVWAPAAAAASAS